VKFTQNWIFGLKIYTIWQPWPRVEEISADLYLTFIGSGARAWIAFFPPKAKLCFTNGVVAIVRWMVMQETPFRKNVPRSNQDGHSLSPWYYKVAA
jgi:hypothetical protein